MSPSSLAGTPKSADSPATVISAQPVVLSAPDRGQDLQVRVSAPATGDNLPIIVFSHGFGSSMNGYAPLADYWAAPAAHAPRARAVEGSRHRAGQRDGSVLRRFEQAIDGP
nr:hypothetical protein [Microtetraspora fusca]